MWLNTYQWFCRNELVGISEGDGGVPAATVFLPA